VEVSGAGEEGNKFSVDCRWRRGLNTADGGGAAAAAGVKSPASPGVEAVLPIVVELVGGWKREATVAAVRGGAKSDEEVGVGAGSKSEAAAEGVASRGGPNREAAGEVAGMV
jgi:hypothetical protein